METHQGKVMTNATLADPKRTRSKQTEDQTYQQKACRAKLSNTACV